MTAEFDAVARLMRHALVHKLGDGVDLVFEFGSRRGGTPHRASDLDACWVPARDGLWDAITVTVDGTLFDLFPMGWPTLERMATYEDSRATVLQRATVTYARSPEAEARLQKLRDRLERRLSPAERGQALATAVQVFERTALPYLKLREQAAAGHVFGSVQESLRVLDPLLHAVALANQQVIDTRKLDQVLALRSLPEGFEPSLREAIDSFVPSTLAASCERLLFATRRWLVRLTDEASATPRSWPESGDYLYAEAHADLQKVEVAAERGDMLALKSAAVSAIHETQVVVQKATRGVDLSSLHVAHELAPLQNHGFPDLLAARDGATAQAFDSRLRSLMEEHGVATGALENVLELEAFLVRWVGG